MTIASPPQSSTKAPNGWLNGNILGTELGSLFSDWNHEMATAIQQALRATGSNAPDFEIALCLARRQRPKPRYTSGVMANTLVTSASGSGAIQ